MYAEQYCLASDSVSDQWAQIEKHSINKTLNNFNWFYNITCPKTQIIMVVPMSLRVVCSSQDTHNLGGHQGPHPPAPRKTLAWSGCLSCPPFRPPGFPAVYPVSCPIVEKMKIGKPGADWVWQQRKPGGNKDKFPMKGRASLMVSGVRKIKNFPKLSSQHQQWTWMVGWWLIRRVSNSYIWTHSLISQTEAAPCGARLCRGLPAELLEKWLLIKKDVKSADWSEEDVMMNKI